MIFDLAVVGGGPAGCAASIVAARNGASVLLLERGRFPRHKVCGEFVSAESLSLLDSLLTHDSRELIDNSPRIAETRIFLDDTVLRANISPAAASITRFDLDIALWNACRTNAVEIRSDAVVEKIQGSGPFQLDIAGEVLEARSVILASGRWSNFTTPATRACLADQKWIGIKAHYYEHSPPASVDLYFFDGGYCGVQPVGLNANGAGTRINACAMVRADTASTLPEVFNQHRALQARSRLWSVAMEPVATSPLVFHEPEPIYKSMLQAGDAATFVDPFIGDGISLALQSGALAAKCLLSFFRKESSLEQASTRYAHEYQRRLAPVFRASSRLRGLLRLPQAVRKPALSVLARAPFLTSQLIKMTR